MTTCYLDQDHQRSCALLLLYRAQQKGSKHVQETCRGEAEWRGRAAGNAGPECQRQVLHGTEAKVSQRMKIMPEFTCYHFLWNKRNLSYKAQLQDNCFFFIFTRYSESCRYRTSPVPNVVSLQPLKSSSPAAGPGKEAVEWGNTV